MSGGVLQRNGEVKLCKRSYPHFQNLTQAAHSPPNQQQLSSRAPSWFQSIYVQVQQCLFVVRRYSMEGHHNRNQTSVSWAAVQLYGLCYCVLSLLVWVFFLKRHNIHVCNGIGAHLGSNCMGWHPAWQRQCTVNNGLYRHV